MCVITAVALNETGMVVLILVTELNFPVSVLMLVFLMQLTGDYLSKCFGFYHHLFWNCLGK